MEDGNTNNPNPNTEGNQSNSEATQAGQETQSSTESSFPLLKEAKEVADRNAELLKDLTKVRNDLLTLKSQEILAGTSGESIPEKVRREETPSEYRKRIEQEMRQGKTDWSEEHDKR